MKLITIGDSITRGTFFENSEWSVAVPNFSDALALLLGADELKNYGQNGISYSSTTDVYPESAISKKIRTIETGDILIIAGGTNDFGAGVELGSEQDERDISFYGGVDVTFRFAREYFPNTKIFVVLPIPRANDGEKNKCGYTLDDYREALRSRADKYGFSVIDGKKLKIDAKNPEQRMQFIPDGLHPNNAGHKLYADFLYEEIKKLL